jgi:ribonuclease R
MKKTIDNKLPQLPDRQTLLNFIKESPTPVGKREIARAFNLDADQKQDLKRLLRELKLDGALDAPQPRRFAERGSLPDSAVIEVVAVSDDGYPLARPARWDEDEAPPHIEIVRERKEDGALGPGDRVLAELRKRGGGRYTASVIRKLAPAPKRIVGVYQEPPGRGGLGLVTPTDRKSRFEWDVAARDRNGAEPGDVVAVEPLAGSMRGALTRKARVVERLGKLTEPRVASLIAIAANDIPVEFPEAALRIAEKAGPTPLGDRLDLRAVPLVTIDGEDSRDFDDAVFAEPDGDPANAGGWRLMVAIADVAWYVRPGDALDREAETRGNSVYFPDRVVPMLPENLSNEWCSLKPHQDRGALVAEMWIDAQGELRRHKFHRALMRSAARLTYTRIERAWRGEPDDELRPLMESVVRPLYGAYAALRSARDRRGAIDLDLPERYVQIDAEGRIAEIRPRERYDSHKLIEEFMICANVAAAETLETKSWPCMYRVHDRPDASKLESLRQFLGTYGLGLPPGPSVRPKEINRIVTLVRGKPEERVVSETILRSQMQASYSPENLGHYGLALQRYAHFTSPIRRYADLLVHRALIGALKLGEGGMARSDGDRFVEIGEKISAAERRAMAAERSAMDRYMAAFMADRVGAEFFGRIGGVTRAGLFVTLAETGADGFIPIRTLGADFFRHDEAAQMLVGSRTGERFGLGDEVRVKLREAEPATGGLLFELLEVVRTARGVGGQPRPGSGGGGGRPTRGDLPGKTARDRARKKQLEALRRGGKKRR